MHLHNALSQANALAGATSASRTANLTGSAVDLLDYEGVAAFVLNSGAATAGTNPTLDVKIQHSDTTTSGDFVDVSPAMAFTQVTTTAGVQLLTKNVSDLKRYVRVIGTLGGTSTPTFDYGVSILAIKTAVS